MKVVRLSEADTETRARTTATLVSAFRADPVERWMYPGDDDYDRDFPRFVEAFGGPAFAAETAWVLDDFSAAALWLPPGAEPDADQIVDVLTSSVPLERQDDTLTALQQMDAAHPRFVHWYLPWLGVDPAAQGRGAGSTLLDACLEVVDMSGLPAYLETPNPRTIQFYERHGFVVVGRTSAGACPTITYMLRAGR